MRCSSCRRGTRDDKRALAGELTPAEDPLRRQDSPGISAIVSCEITKCAQLGRIERDIEDPELKRTFCGLHTWPITSRVCRAIRELGFRSNPADELIAATSLIHNVRLITGDRTTRRSKRVPIAR